MKFNLKDESSRSTESLVGKEIKLSEIKSVASTAS